MLGTFPSFLPSVRNFTRSPSKISRHKSVLVSTNINFFTYKTRPHFMQWLMQNLRGLMKMFVRREVRMRNIAGSRTLARPCDGLVRSGGCPARAHDVSVLFFEALVALADIRACVQEMEGRTKVAAQAYTCTKGESAGSWNARWRRMSREARQ